MSTEETFGTLAVHRLPLYNPSRLKDAEIIAAFAARKSLLDRLITDLDAEQPKSRAQHHLIVGQRGMGKTLLLARIAAEIRTGPLASRFIPLTFAEEQYSIDRLSKFWLNCLDSLADEQDRAGAQAVVAKIDGIVRQLTSQLSAQKNDEALAALAMEAFLQAAATTGRRPVLLVDNLQIVFARLSREEAHSLREVLMRPDCPVLIGASPIPLTESQDYGAAFYDHFKVHYLRPLDADEMRAQMLHLACAVGRDDVHQRVVDHPERLKVLHQLTGGNPRTTVTLIFLYAEDFAPTVFSDLENLLDRVTPLYKAIFEELSQQQQVLASAIANLWNPVTSRMLEENTGLASTQISPQLERLVKTGFIEKVELFGNASTGYQISERFFNVWFLMRSSSRRQRREVEFLTRFLQVVYESPDRERLARHLMTESDFSSDRYLLSQAVAESLSNRLEGEDLIRHAQLAVLSSRDREKRRKFSEILDITTLPKETIAFSELRDKLKALVPTQLVVSPEQFADAILGDRKMFRDGERERLAVRPASLSGDEISIVMEAVETSRQQDELTYSPESVAWFSNRLMSGQIRSFSDVDDWNRAFTATDVRGNFEIMVDTLPRGLGRQISCEALSHIRGRLTPKPTDSSLQWTIWGSRLQGPLHLDKDAEDAYRRAIARDPANGTAWNNLGVLMHEKQRFQEAEDVYLQAIACNPESTDRWTNLGLLLAETRRKQEAENAFLKAISSDTENSTAWSALGCLLEDTQHYQEAEQAYRKAIACTIVDREAWNNFGRFLYDDLHRYDEAKIALAKGIELGPPDGMAQNHLVWMYRDYLGELATARSLFSSMQEKKREWLPISEYFLLHESLFSAYEGNWGIAKQYLTEALDSVQDNLSPLATSAWMRGSAVLLHLNYGAELLGFLRERGDKERLRPWYEAINALQLGDRRYLQNIAPEIRTTAEKFYDEIERRLNALPDSTRRRPLPAKPKATRKRKR